METYVLVTWPEVQEYMEEDWFQGEAILYQRINNKQKYLDSAYFIPTDRILFEGNL